MTSNYRSNTYYRKARKEETKEKGGREMEMNGKRRKRWKLAPPSLPNRGHGFS